MFPAALVNLFIPAKCIVCGQTLLKDERHICLNCKADMPFTYYPIYADGARAAANPMADAFNALVQKGIEEKEGSFSGVSTYEPYVAAVALFFYQEGYKNITQALKYHGNIPAGRYFASLLAEKLSSGGLTGLDAVIPVPLHWMRRFKRGFNQAQIIAGEVARILDAPLRTDILYRRSSTGTQTRLSGEARTANVVGAFGARPGKFAEPETGTIGPKILLIDDVFTTGSTMYACYSALKASYPASRITIATLAFVP